MRRVQQALSAGAKAAQAAEARAQRLLATSERPSERGSEPEPQRRRTAPTPLTQPAGVDVQEAQAGGAFNYQISGILCIVKPV